MFPDEPKTTPKNERGYSVGEVEILLKLSELEMEIKQLKEARYVKREEFEPVQRIVYGMVGVILLAFLGAVVVLVLK